MKRTQCMTQYQNWNQHWKSETTMNQERVLATLSSGLIFAILLRSLDIQQEWRRQTKRNSCTNRRKKKNPMMLISEKKGVYTGCC